MARRRPSTPKPPDDYPKSEDFLAYARKLFTEWDTAEEFNRKAQLEDHAFAVGDQWASRMRNRRERLRKPVITVNRAPAFLGVIVGNRRLNQTVIKIRPDRDGTADGARVREGLIRQIQKNSKADRAYDTALQNCAIGGLGSFQVRLRYAAADVFEQDICIEQLPNPAQVIYDPFAVDPTAKDARGCFVVEEVPLKDFHETYPNATPSDMAVFNTNYSSARAAGWYKPETVRIVDFWRMRRRRGEIALLVDGRIAEVPKDADDLFYAQVAVDKLGYPIIRDTYFPYAEMYRLTFLDILEGPYQLPIQRIPVFRVPGWEIWSGEQRHRFGLIRFLKDPMRMHNYWRSVIVERLMQASKARWIAGQTAIQGRETQWRNSHLEDDSVLIYNDEEGQAPVSVPPVQIEAGLLEQANATVQDIKDVSNIHEASLGQQSNFVSGRALDRAQRVSELGTVIYHDNLNSAIEEAGEVINDLIPIVYDTPRVVKIIGTDDQERLVRINGSNQSTPENEFDGPVDLTSGKYSVTLDTGPSFATKRAEAAEAMLNLINALPQVVQVAADQIIEAQDWPGAEKIAKRIRATLPPGVVGEEALTPTQREEQARQVQVAEEQAALVRASAEADLQLKQAQAREALARATQAEALALKAMAEAEKAKAEADLVDDRFELEVQSRGVQDEIAAATATAQLIRNRESPNE